MDQATARFWVRTVYDSVMGGPPDDPAEGARVAEAIEGHSVMMMGNHGVTVVGDAVVGDAVVGATVVGDALGDPLGDTLGSSVSPGSVRDADGAVLATLYALAKRANLPEMGIIAATAAVSAGVVAEAVYAAWIVRPIVRDVLPTVKSSEPPLDRKRFLSFYVPLALSPLLGLAAQPILTAGISRMPSPTESLAILPALNGFS